MTNVWSRLLINIPQMILAVENESRQRGDALLSKFAKSADDLKITLRKDRRTGAPDFLGELAAEEARYYDIALVAWEAQNQTLQATAEAVIFGSGRPPIHLPNFLSRRRSSICRLRGTGAGSPLARWLTRCPSCRSLSASLS